MSDVESFQVPVREDITNLGVHLTEAENLLSNFFDVDMSKEYKKRAHSAVQGKATCFKG